MEPWEHTWHVDESGTLIRDERDYRIAETIELDIPPQEQSNARLAAAAPEMARLLLELEWGGEPVRAIAGPIATCPSCLGMRPQLSRDAGPRGGHRKDCRLIAVLRKAGVRE